jgi:trehalose-6-phosphate synthase
MPLAERRDRHQAMLEVLERNSISAWHTSFVDTLESVGGQAPELKLKAG